MSDQSLRQVNAYIVPGEPCLLIDPGWPSEAAFRSLQSQLKEIGIGPADIGQVVITHAHVDHFGMTHRLKQISRAKIAYHHLEAGFIESRFINRNVYPAMISRWLKINGLSPETVSQGFNGLMGRGEHVQPVPADLTLYGGEVISTGSFHLQVLWTPGHSGGHVCLYEPTRKVLFSGDHVLPTITPVVGLHPGTDASGLGDYLNSLGSVRRLDAALVLPGHGAPFADLQARVDQIVGHHQERESEILQAVKDGSGTAFEVAVQITWTFRGRPVRFHDLTEPDRILALLETAAHLEYMRDGRRVTQIFKGGAISYRAAASVRGGVL